MLVVIDGRGNEYNPDNLTIELLAITRRSTGLSCILDSGATKTDYGGKWKVYDHAYGISINGEKSFLVPPVLVYFQKEDLCSSHSLVTSFTQGTSFPETKQESFESYLNQLLH